MERSNPHAQTEHFLGEGNTIFLVCVQTKAVEPCVARPKSYFPVC